MIAGAPATVPAFQPLRMQRSLVLGLLLLLAALAGGAWWFLRDNTPPPAPTIGSETPSGAVGPAAASTGVATAATEGDRATREAVASGPALLLDDPEIRAGLCGFKGRIVDHLKNPVADCGVRIYRGAMDSVLPSDPDLFAPTSNYVPNYVAGETRTQSDGKWQLTGVWPRAFYLLFAGLGTDCPVHQIVTRTPSPGEIVDLGDIVLPHAGVIVGTVNDDNGEPLPGALVRAADLPGTLAAFFPVERFDPEGALLVREPNFPQRVLEMPGWVKAAFDQLPIPTTRTDGDGRFRLVGVVPGSNLLATTASGFLSDMKPSVIVRAGQEKDVGTIRMKRGEELVGKVVDTAGKAIADAEVLAGSTLSMAPVDLACRVGRSDADGKFSGQGFAPGKVTVAARRGKGHAWTLAEPQSILGEVVVALPATFALVATVLLADGKPAATTRLQLLQGRAGNGAAEMFLLGFVPPIDLKDRTSALGEGRWKIDNLLPGAYTLVVDAPGHAHAFATFDLATTDAAVKIDLVTPKHFTVQVLGPEDRPIKNALIYGESRGGADGIDMPVLCGRTRDDGVLIIDKLRADELRVSAEHPKWGAVHGSVKLGESLTLRMLPPGALTGIVRENGKPPEPGKFTLALERRGGGEARGPLDSVPPLVTPGLDGTFAVQALQPGEYSVQAIKALDGLRSPGGVFGFAQEMMIANNLPRAQAQVRSGETAQVVLEAGEKPIDGPTAQLAGTLTIDGRLGAGCAITAQANNRRFSARVDARGRFDFGTVPAGELRLEVLPATDGTLLDVSEELWAGHVDLAAGDVRELPIDIATTTIQGMCVDQAGAPVAGVSVRAEGRLGDEKRMSHLHRSTPTDARGEFRFDRVVAGSWTFSVRGQRGGMRARLEPIVVASGVPVTDLRIVLQPAIHVRGKVDLTPFGNHKPRWIWIEVSKVPDDAGPEARGEYVDGIGVDVGTGAFDTESLTAGRYRLRMHGEVAPREQGEWTMEDLVVPPTGLTDVMLRSTGRVTR